MLALTPPALLDPAFILKARREWDAATDHPDHGRVTSMLDAMAECVRQLRGHAAECVDADVRECITGRVGCFSVLEDAAGDLGMAAWVWTDRKERGRDALRHGGRA